MNIGLYVIGDEILSGRRTDRHMAAVSRQLKQRGLVLHWVQFLPDDQELLASRFKDSFASGDIVFSAGGIGGTPDDLTRLAVSQALGIELQRHPQAIPILEKFSARRGRALNEEHYKMIEFPKGAALIPNPVNTIPGFSISNHHFVPGFPRMAGPMIEWVLEHYYSHLKNTDYIEQSVIVHGIAESDLVTLMDELQARYAVKAFSLPRMIENGFLVELGVKGKKKAVRQAMKQITAQLEIKGADWDNGNNPID